MRRHVAAARRGSLARLLLAALIALAAAAATAQTDAPTSSASLAGRLLVATPQIGDAIFGRSVVYLVRHGAQGAFGLIINKPVRNASFAELFDMLRVAGAPASGSLDVFFGGPVQPGLGFVLHSDDLTMPSSEPAGTGLAMTGDAAMLQAIAAGEGPRRWLFMLGYAGWAPDQLEMEIGRGDWLAVPADPDLVFASDPADMWERAMALHELPL